MELAVDELKNESEERDLEEVGEYLEDHLLKV